MRSGFIVVAACVMTFEARDSAAKVVPARFKMSATGPPSVQCTRSAHVQQHVGHSVHGSLRTSASQTGTTQQHVHATRSQADRRTITQSFMQFSRGLALDAHNRNINTLNIQGSINKSPSAPDLSLEHSNSVEKTSPTSVHRYVQEKPISRRTLASCALLNPGLLHRHALSVDETAANYRMSHESLQGSGSQGSMAMDLHLDCPVTLRVRDKRRNQLRRQRRVDEEERQPQDESRRNSHSCSPRLPAHYHKDFNISHSIAGGSAHQLPTHSSVHYSSNRRSSNASDCTHRSRSKRRDCPHSRGRLERAISSDSRLTGAIPKCHYHNYYHHNHHHHQQHRHNNSPSAQTSTEQEPSGCSSDTDVRKIVNVIHTRAQESNCC